MAALTKKIVEQERIIKLKESSDVKIMNLKSEILVISKIKSLTKKITLLMKKKMLFSS